MAKRRFFPESLGVLGCLFLSGTASLMLEVVWSRHLKLVFGSTTLAVSTILVAYMLGLGLGGLLGGKISGRVRNGVGLYGLFEIAIGVYALCVPALLSVFPWVNGALLIGMGFWPAVLLRFLLILLFFLLPTVLMGATLPILVVVLLKQRPKLADRVGLLYGLNTLGAVLGTVISAFWLFPTIGVRLTNLTAAGIDVATGLIAIFLLAPRFAGSRVAAAATQDRPSVTSQVAGSTADGDHGPGSLWDPLLLSYGLVGFTALGYEVCWTRVLSMVLGSSVYAFASMLAAFLTGIAVGSLVGRRWFDSLRMPALVYAFGLALLGVLAFATTAAFHFLPDLFLTIVDWTGVAGVMNATANVVAPSVIMLAPTLVLGALFPLLTYAVSVGAEEHGRSVGNVYFVNTLGSAAGAFLVGFVLIPRLGLATTIALCVGLNLATAAAVLMWQRQWTGGPRAGAAVFLVVMTVWTVAAPPAWDAQAMTRGVYNRPSMQLDFGLALDPYEGMPEDEILYYRDGLNTTVSVHRSESGTDLRLNGKPDASLGDMSTQILLGELPMLYGPPAGQVLVIGYASGVTTGCVTLHDPQRVDVVEIEPAVLRASHYFDEFNYRPLDNERVRVIVDDARTYLSYTDRRYDVIISEPSNPWIAGCSNLFTREAFALAHEALKPGGRLLQWVQLYDMDSPTFLSILRAIRAEFRYLHVFRYKAGYPDLFIFASDEPLGVADLPEWDALPPAVQDDLARIRISSTKELWSLMRLAPAAVDTMLEEGGITNTDDNMFVELRMPWVKKDFPKIAAEMEERFRRGATALFTGSDTDLDGDMLGELALAYLNGRDDGQVGRALLKEADARGVSSHALVAHAMEIWRDGAGNAMEALAILDRAAAVGPDLFAPHFHRAKVRYATGDFQGALADIEIAVERQPRNYRARHLRLRTLGALDRVAEAWPDVEFLQEHRAGDLEPRVWVDVAAAQATVGHLHEAIATMRAYLERVPVAAAQWGMLARMYSETGNEEEAGLARRNGERAAHNLLRLRQRAARRAARFGSRAEATRILESILESDPGYLPAAEDLRRLQGSPAM